MIEVTRCESIEVSCWHEAATCVVAVVSDAEIENDGAGLV